MGLFNCRRTFWTANEELSSEGTALKLNHKDRALIIIEIIPIKQTVGRISSRNATRQANEHSTHENQTMLSQKRATRE